MEGFFILTIAVLSSLVIAIILVSIKNDFYSYNKECMVWGKRFNFIKWIKRIFR